MYPICEVLLYTAFNSTSCTWGISFWLSSSSQLVAPPTPIGLMWPSERVRLRLHLSPGVQTPEKSRRPRRKLRKGRGESEAMAYQQKLAEKLIILNERGNGVLIRMNYIKKVRETKISSTNDASRRGEIRN